MPSRVSRRRSTSSDARIVTADIEVVPPPCTGSEQVKRMAALVAAGEAPLPELEPSAQNALLTEVARLRRERLLDFIARAIAHDLERLNKN